MLTSEQQSIITEIEEIFDKSDNINNEDLDIIRGLVSKLPEDIQGDYGEIFTLIGQGIDL
jgi:hypothetical protein